MARHSRTVGAMRETHVAWAQCGSLLIGGSGSLNLIAHMAGEAILNILRAYQAMNTWFLVVIILLGVGALTLRRYDVQRVLIWIMFGWFALDALLPGCRSEHL